MIFWARKCPPLCRNSAADSVLVMTPGLFKLMWSTGYVHTKSVRHAAYSGHVRTGQLGCAKTA